MQVEIRISDVVYDIRNKSHLEVATIEDVNKRYLIEAGTEKLDEIHRCIIEADSRVRFSLRRFLARDNEGDISIENIPTTLIYAMSISERRSRSNGAILSSMIHAALVSMALSLFYLSVGEAELHKRHAAMAENQINIIETTLGVKMPPRM